jgi:protein-disulfide isomerase
MTALLALCVTAGCKAQSTPQAAPDLKLDRRVEVMVRSQFNIPQDFNVTIGVRAPSQVPGYEKLPITISHGEKKSVVDFLISTDNQKLARLETYDLNKDPAFSIDVAGRPIRGNPAAKVTVINFDDLECPYCARMHQQLFPATLEHYKGLVRFIYKDNPLPAEMHPWAMHAAVDANCLAELNGNAYWSYVDYLHSHDDEVTGETRDLPKSFEALNRIARQEATLARFDSGKLAQLDACLGKQDETPILASLKEGESLGVDGTPALFIDGERVTGAVPQELLWMSIDRALRAAGVEPPAMPAIPPQAAVSRN